MYFARREKVRRFIRALEDAQTDHERDTGESKAWAKGVEGAFADPQQFAGEATAFVRAAAIRSHLAVATAAVVANDGRSDVAFDLMDAADATLRSDVLDLKRRLGPLAATPPDGRSKKSARQEAHAVCLELTNELERRIAPLLPSGDADTVTFVIERAQLTGEVAEPPRSNEVHE